MEGTPDGRTEKQRLDRISGQILNSFHFTGGYDHNYVLGRPGEKKIMANAYRGKEWNCSYEGNSCCGVQFYAGKLFIESRPEKVVRPITTSAFCLESVLSK